MHSLMLETRRSIPQASLYILPSRFRAFSPASSPGTRRVCRHAKGNVVNRRLHQEPLLGLDDLLPLLVRIAGVQITAFRVPKRASSSFKLFKRCENIEKGHFLGGSPETKSTCLPRGRVKNARANKIAEDLREILGRDARLAGDVRSGDGAIFLVLR
jgi:hypothetical protein